MDNKYKYSYEKTADYCYENSDVLINLLNIRDDKNLYDVERHFVTIKVALLNEQPLQGNFDFDYLKSIHKLNLMGMKYLIN